MKSVLQHCVVFALVAIVAGLFGFAGRLDAIASIASVLCVIFSGLALWSVCLAVMQRRPRP